MLVTLASLILSNFCLIPDLYAKIPSLYSQIPDFYADICLLGFHCAGNVQGKVLIFRLKSVYNDGARDMRMRGRGGRGHVGGKKIARVCTRNYSGA